MDNAQPQCVQRASVAICVTLHAANNTNERHYTAVPHASVNRTWEHVAWWYARSSELVPNQLRQGHCQGHSVCDWWGADLYITKHRTERPSMKWGQAVIRIWVGESATTKTKTTTAAINDNCTKKHLPWAVPVKDDVHCAMGQMRTPASPGLIRNQTLLNDNSK